MSRIPANDGCCLEDLMICRTGFKRGIIALSPTFKLSTYHWWALPPVPCVQPTWPGKFLHLFYHPGLFKWVQQSRIEVKVECNGSGVSKARRVEVGFVLQWQQGGWHWRRRWWWFWRENGRQSAFFIQICKRVRLKLVGSWFCTCKSHHISWDLGHMGFGSHRVWVMGYCGCMGYWLGFPAYQVGN